MNPLSPDAAPIPVPKMSEEEWRAELIKRARNCVAVEKSLKEKYPDRKFSWMDSPAALRVIIDLDAGMGDGFHRAHNVLALVGETP